MDVLLYRVYGCIWAVLFDGRRSTAAVQHLEHSRVDAPVAALELAYVLKRLYSAVAADYCCVVRLCATRLFVIHALVSTLRLAVSAHW